MSTAVNTSGSQTATLTTEHTLATITAAGKYVLSVDVANLADASETCTLRIYGKARSGDTERLLESATVNGASIKKLIESPEVYSPHHLKATLEQNGGTGRAFPWAIYEEVTPANFGDLAITASTGRVTVGTNADKSDYALSAAGNTAVVDEWETQSQADPTGFHVNLLEVNGASQTAGDVVALINALNDVSAADILTTAMTEAYSTKGGTLTLSQFAYEVVQHLQERAITGTTDTVKKRDQSTTAFTLELDDSADPTSSTRAT